MDDGLVVPEKNGEKLSKLGALSLAIVQTASQITSTLMSR